jgi:Flp pilus assembly protein TadD
MGILRIHRNQVSRIALAAALAASLGGCVTNKPLVTGSINAPQRYTAEDWRKQVDQLAGQYREQPNDPRIAVAYAHALRQTGQRAQAAAVLQQASHKNSKNSEVLGAYGRALADIGQFNQALQVLSKAHTPDQPDWRVLNAQGAVHDQLGNHAEAQRYYETALRIVPNEPAVLSNLGLSYALSKDLNRAEAVLRRADGPNADPRVRQNLGLVLALQGKFDESQRTTAGLLTPEQASQNLAYFREMMTKDTKKKTASSGGKKQEPKKPLDLGQIASTN